MQKLIREGVSLAFEDHGTFGDAVVLVHGWGCDNTALQPQQEFFAASHRVISVDLRGHGESDSPDQAYPVEQFADDLQWLLAQIGIERAALIGHSMGGSIALETAYRYPKAVTAVAMIDSVFEAPVELHQLLAPLLPGIAGVAYESSYREIMLALSLPTDVEGIDSLLGSLPRAPQHVLLSTLQEHLEVHDFARAASHCSAPVGYIGASRPLADLNGLKRLIPQLLTGQVLGAGHFAPCLVPRQVNAQLEQFLCLADQFNRTNPLPAI